MTQLKRHVFAVVSVIVIGELLRLIPIKLSVQTVELGGSLFYAPLVLSHLISASPYVLGGYLARSGFVVTAAIFGAVLWIWAIDVLHRIAKAANPDALWLEVARLNTLNLVSSFTLILASAYLGQRLYSRLHNDRPSNQLLQQTGER